MSSRGHEMMFTALLLPTLLALPSQDAGGSPVGDARADTSGNDVARAGLVVKGVRKRLLGRLLQLDGSAWAGANLRFISWPDWNYPGMGRFDDLHAVSDKRGRFLVQGLQHRRYYVWAWQAEGKDSYRVSEPGCFLLPGLPFVLKEQERQQRKQLVTIDVEGWERFGPFRIAVREDPFEGVYSHSIARQLDPLPWIPTRLSIDKTTKETLELPVLPWSRVRVEVLGKGGLLFYRKSISLNAEGDGPAETEISPEISGQWAANFYLDERKRKKAMGYKLYQRYMGRLVELPGADRDGKFPIALPYQKRHRSQSRFWWERMPWYVGRLKGRAEASDYNLYRRTRLGRRLQVDGALGILQRSYPLKVRLKSGDKKVLSDVPILIWQRQRIASYVRTTYVLPGTLVKTDDQGRLDYPWLSKEEFVLLAILSDELLDQLMGVSKSPIHPMVLLHRGLGIDLVKDRPLVIDVRGLQRVDFRVAWDREKVRESPVVNIFGPVADSRGHPRLLRLPCDRRGRAVALIPLLHQLPFLARSLQGVAKGTLTTQGEGRGGQSMEIAVKIPDGIEISGRVVDSAGEPLGDVSMVLANRSSSARGRNNIIGFDQSRSSMLVDKQGRFRIFQKEIHAGLRLFVQRTRDGRLLHQSMHPLDVSGKLTDLVIEVQGIEAKPTQKRRRLPAPKLPRVPVKKK